MRPPISTPPRILCVDDRVSSLEVRRALLRAAGFDVLVASDPESALAITDKVPVDLVVLDYSFPGHISGEELARKLRARQPGLPLIMLSGYPDLPASARDSVDMLIIKGAERPADMLTAIRHLLDKRASEASSHEAQNSPAASGRHKAAPRADQKHSTKDKLVS